MLVLIPITVKGMLICFSMPLCPYRVGVFQSFGVSFLSIMIWLSLASNYPAHSYFKAGVMSAIPILGWEIAYLYWCCEPATNRLLIWFRCACVSV